MLSYFCPIRLPKQPASAEVRISGDREHDGAEAQPFNLLLLGLYLMIGGKRLRRIGVTCLHPSWRMLASTCRLRAS